MVEPNLVATGQAIPIWYDTYYNGGEFHTPSQMAGLAILPFHELYRKIKGKLPSGSLWTNYQAITASDGAMQRVIVLPPGAPAAARKALAAAIVALNADKDHAAEALSTIGFVPEWEAGPAVDKTVQTALSVSPEVRSFLADYMKAAGK